MNLPRSAGLAFKTWLLWMLLVVCLGSECMRRASFPGPFLNRAYSEVFAAIQAADVQWLFVICISVYLAGFIWLLRALNPVSHSWRDEVQPGTPPVAQASPPTRIRGPLCYVWEAVPGRARLDASEVFALGLYGIGVLAYALSYDQASKSTDALLLCFGITLLFGFRAWRVVEVKRIRPFNITGVVLAIMLILLFIATVWHPSSLNRFQYRGQVRWSGLWDNPNTFGILMRCVARGYGSGASARS